MQIFNPLRIFFIYYSDIYGIDTLLILISGGGVILEKNKICNHCAHHLYTALHYGWNISESQQNDILAE